MDTPESIKSALLVVDSVPIENGPAAIKTRMETASSYRIDVGTVDMFDLAQIEGKDLVIVCSRQAPTALRESKIPIIVCHPIALYDFGMTLATSNTDFGTVEGRMVQIDNRFFGHPLTAGQQGIFQISGEVIENGWARPGSDAAVGATLAENAAKAVIFAYEQGYRMPTMTATHRRVGFLIGCNQQDQLQHDGWSLFDAAVHWATHGGGALHRPAAIEKPPVAADETEPAKVFTRDEYEKYYQDRISKHVLTRLSAIFSVIGIAGFAALISLGWNQLNTRIENEVKDEVAIAEKNIYTRIDEIEEENTKTIGNFKTALEKTVNDRMEGEVAKTLLRTAQLHDQLKLEAKGVVEEELSKEKLHELVKKTLSDEEIVKFLAGEAANAISKDKYIDSILSDRFRPILHNQSGKNDVHQRLQALTMLMFFESNRERLREDLLQVIGEKGPKLDELRTIALGALEPKNDPVLDKEMLAAVLTLFERTKKPSEAFREKAAICLSRFAGGHADQLYEWLRQTNRFEYDRIIADALAGNQNNQTLTVFKKMIASDKHRLRRLGLYGLSDLDPKSELEADIRQEITNAILALLAQDDKQRHPFLSPSEQRGVKKYIENLFTAWKDEDIKTLVALRADAAKYTPIRLSEVYAQIRITGGRLRAGLPYSTKENMVADLLLPKLPQPALYNLLRLEDWRHVNNKLEDIKNDNRAWDILLYNWVARLRLEDPKKIDNKKIFTDLHTNASTPDDFLYRTAPVEAILLSLKFGETYLAYEFLDRFKNTYVGEVETQAEFKGKPALQLALKKEDWSSVEKMLVDQEVGSEVWSALLYGWIESSQRDASKQIPDEQILSDLYTVAAASDDFLYERKPTRAVEYCLNNGEASLVDAFLNRFKETYVGAKHPETNKRFRGDKSLRIAFERDARSTPPFGTTLKHIHQLSVDDENSLRVAERIIAVLDRIKLNDEVEKIIYDEAYREFLYGNIRSVRSDMKNDGIVRVSVRALDKFDYSEAMMLESAAVLMDLLLQIPNIQSDGSAISDSGLRSINERKRRIVSEALGILRHYSRKSKNQAAYLLEIEKGLALLQDSRFSYARMQLASFIASEYVKRSNDDLKKEQYASALSDLKKAKSILSRRAEESKEIYGFGSTSVYTAFKMLGLKSLASGDSQVAHDAMTEAVELAKTERQKAGAKENIGLLFIKKQNWNEAFKNSEEVVKIKADMAWNWLVRAISAHRLQKQDEVATSVKNWCQYRTRKDLEDLNKYIPDEINTFDVEGTRMTQSSCIAYKN